MPNSSRPLQSTRLENVRLEGERAWFDLDGQPIELAGEAAAPAVQSLQAFYHAAQHAYQSAPAHPGISAVQIPWWRRLRAWLADWVGGRRETARATPPPPAAPASAATDARARGAPPAASEGAAPEAQPAAPPDSPSARTSKTAAARPAPAAQPPRRAGLGPSVESPPRPSAPIPLLRAAFADEKGVHLIWSQPAAAGSKAETELIYGFDSPVAAGLQACYGQLAAMGHNVVDLGAWQAVPARAPAPGPSPAPSVSHSPPATAAAGPVPPHSLPEKSPASAAADQRYLKLSSQRSEIASRLVVIPAEGDPRPEVITGAETFFNALHAAADEGVPEADRLTFLKCRPVKGELKVVELGFGRKAGAAAEPARTESAAAWWKQAQKLREAESPPPAPRPGGPTAAAPQAELFGK